MPIPAQTSVGDSAPPPPLAFIHTVYKAFQEAEHAVGGPVERYYHISGYTVRLRFAGHELVPALTLALEHLEVAPGEKPDFTVCLWDSTSTGTAMPIPAWLPEDYTIRSEVRGQSDERYHTTYVTHSGVLSLIDLEQNLAIYWIRDASNLPSYEMTAPLRPIFNWWLGQRGCQLVHAAGVGTAEGGVLLVGKGGSGKSNTALACLASPLGLAGDDFCIVTCGDANPTVHSLYNVAKTHASDLDRVPFLRPYISNPEQLSYEKAIYFLHRNFPGKVLNSFPLRAILVPRVTGQPQTFLTKTTPGAALRALAPTTILMLPDAGGEALKAMATVVRQVPCYSLELGTETAQIPEVISNLLAQS